MTEAGNYLPQTFEELLSDAAEIADLQAQEVQGAGNVERIHTGLVVGIQPGLVLRRTRKSCAKQRDAGRDAGRV